MYKFLFILILLVSCHTSLEREYGSQIKNNFTFVDKVINGADSLDKIISDANLTTSLWRFHMVLATQKLKGLILNNKFREGFNFEKDTLIEIHQIKEINNSPYVLYAIHKIKIRSKFTGEIIWFIFNNKEGVWKFDWFEICNNPQLPDVDEPCDKS